MLTLSASVQIIGFCAPAAQTAADITILWSLKPFAVPPISFSLPVISSPSGSSTAFPPSELMSAAVDLSLSLSFILSLSALIILVVPSANEAQTASAGTRSGICEALISIALSLLFFTVAESAS